MVHSNFLGNATFQIKRDIEKNVCKNYNSKIFWNYNSK